MKNNLKNIFIYKKINKINNIEQQKFNIILSNEFYWRRIKKLPKTSIKEAQKLAYSIFYKNIPNIEKYTFKVFKKNQNEFLFLAYDKEKIFNFLNDILSKDLNKINTITFLDLILINKELEEIEINKNIFIKKINNFYSIFYKTNDIENNKNNFNFSEYKITKVFNFETSISKNNNKNLFNLFIFLNITLCIFLFMNLFSYKLFFNNAQDKLDKLYQETKLPKTTLQLNNIHSKYLELSTREYNIRKVFEIISILDFKTLNIEIEKEYIYIKNIKENEKVKIIELIKKNNIKIDISIEEDNLLKVII